MKRTQIWEFIGANWLPLVTVTAAAVAAALQLFGVVSDTITLSIILAILCLLATTEIIERPKRFEGLDSKLEKIEATVLERTEQLEQRLTDGIGHVISSLQGVSVRIYHDRDKFWTDVENSIARAERHIDVTRLQADRSATDAYYSLLAKAVKEKGLRLRRVAFLQEHALIEQTRRELEGMKNSTYYVGVYDVGLRELPSMMEFIIIDDREIFVGGGYLSAEHQSMSFWSDHPFLIQAFSHHFDTLWQQSIRVHTVDEFDKFLRRTVSTLSVLPTYEETYKLSIDIARSSTDRRLWVTGFTPNRGIHRNEFRSTVAQRLRDKREIEYKAVTCIRNIDDIQQILSEWEEWYSGTNYLLRATVDMPYFLDVFISDDEELLIGITAREAFEGYTNCLRIRDPVVVRAVADWYNTHLWPDCIEIIGRSGPNEVGIAEVKRRLAILRTV